MGGYHTYKASSLKLWQCGALGRKIEVSSTSNGFHDGDKDRESNLTQGRQWE
jgi:hypothetical protein